MKCCNPISVRLVVKCWFWIGTILVGNGILRRANTTYSNTLQYHQLVKDIGLDNDVVTVLPSGTNVTSVSSMGGDQVDHEHEGRTPAGNTVAPPLEVLPNDSIYILNYWDSSPIVIEKYKLVFFTVPKVACTTWKKAFRKMEGIPGWRRERPPPKEIPHDPKYNKLKYLSHYSLEDAQRMMADPSYTKAIFLRDPKQRFLSAFLDKGKHADGSYVKGTCCRGGGRGGANCWAEKNRTLSNFAELIKQGCRDVHWRPQTERMESKYWPHINFVGHFETIEEDSQRLLERIGAWDEHGKTGWGIHKNLTMFGKESNTNKHKTGAGNKLLEWYTPELESWVEEFYAGDYNNPYLNFTMTSITNQYY